MIRQILFCDDDQALQRLIQKKFEKYREQFSVELADDGVMALEILRKKPISLLITDLQMPKMDGYALLAQVKEHYPDIPVLVTTAFGKPKTKQALLDQGASAYIEKPIVIDELASDIISFLQKETEGGVLNNASLEMFIQLIEMEQKTCTIRVSDKKSGLRGILFFVDGDLINARIKTTQGSDAAYRIFSWSEVSLSIENVCSGIPRKIHDDLQAILLEAMRLKDESDNDGHPIEEDEPAEDLQSNKKVDRQDRVLEKRTEEASVPTPSPQPAITDPVQKINNSFKTTKNYIHGVESVSLADDDTIMDVARRIGDAFGFKGLKACYISNGDPLDKILLPSDKNLVIKVSPKCTRDAILDTLTHSTA